MKTSRARFALVSAAALVSTNLALAHPGHDGDHGLTWEFRHLADYPLATAWWSVVLVAAAWGVGQIASAVAGRYQSLRKSAVRRGK